MKNAGAIKVCGLTIPVREGSAVDQPGLEKAYGCYDVDTSTLWLDEQNPKHTRSFWKTHETLHALVHLSGAVYAMASALGVKREDPRIDDWEESIVRILTPHVLETFGPPREVK
jgi:hypothetical protein